MSRAAEGEEVEGKLFFKFSEQRVPSVVKEVFLHKGWLEWDPDKHPESLWSMHWKSGRFKLSDWDRWGCVASPRFQNFSAQ
jgi:hypothetical protein